MRIFTCLTAFLLITTATSFAQVGINTDTPDPSSALDINSTTGGLLPPRMTTVERDAITNAAKGLIIFNTTTNSLEINSGDPGAEDWTLLPAEPVVEEPKSVTIYYNGTGTIPTQDDFFYDLPLGAQADEILAINNDIFEVIGDGRIRVLEAGEYIINSSFSVENLRGGSRKYILAVFINGVRTGYMARGFVSIPGPVSNTEFWGTSGSFQYELAANDVVNIQYVLNNGGNSVTPNLLHIGLLKL